MTKTLHDVAICPRKDMASPPTSTVSLPIEIQYVIIDEFAGALGEDDNPGAVRELCRVCSLWAQHAQSHLFRSIQLGSSGRKQRRFVALITQNPTIGRHVQALSITAQPMSDIASLFEHGGHPLPNLSTLRLSWMVFGSIPVLQYLRAQITCLTIVGSSFDSLQILDLLVSSFSRLRWLHLLECLCPNTKPHVDDPLPARPSDLNLKCLRLGSGGVLHFIMEWISTRREQIHIDMLEIEDIDTPDIPQLNVVLAGLGRFVRHLRLDIYADSPKSNPVPISVGLCGALETIVLCGMCQDGYISTIARLASPALTELSFTIQLRESMARAPEGDEWGCRWDKLGALLGSPNLVGLTAVHIMFRDGGWADREAYRVAIRQVKRRVQGWALLDKVKLGYWPEGVVEPFTTDVLKMVSDANAGLDV
ncbi:hypothetical protein B0H17DRAFT_1086718 [Mycena rosella]|uniref:Uncharacterized protein n=1 Tax=Mycena rosella TaxID=1033263 RepID=A0AAD7CYJ1_MYCRO|nr:hypothetical protein B0H17DRAFT_1086718 [Mycena rosella]